MGGVLQSKLNDRPGYSMAYYRREWKWAEYDEGETDSEDDEETMRQKMVLKKLLMSFLLGTSLRQFNFLTIFQFFWY